MTSPLTETLVLHRLPDLSRIASPDKGWRMILVVDSETTGLDSSVDKMIEISLLPIYLDETTGEIKGCGEGYSGLEDPGDRKVSDKAFATHKIKPEEYLGKRFDDEKVDQLLLAADGVVAHSAAFDRKFFDQRFLLSKSVNWGCSLTEVPWQEWGFGARVLEYIAFKKGFFFEAHRAEEDVKALATCLSLTYGENQKTAMSVLWESMKKPTYLLAIPVTPFDTGEIFKKRRAEGAYWNWSGSPASPGVPEKTWWATVTAEELVTELLWVQQVIWHSRPTFKVAITPSDASLRFSDRFGMPQLTQYTTERGYPELAGNPVLSQQLFPQSVAAEFEF